MRPGKTIYIHCQDEDRRGVLSYVLFCQRFRVTTDVSDKMDLALIVDDKQAFAHAVRLGSQYPVLILADSSAGANFDYLSNASTLDGTHDRASGAHTDSRSQEAWPKAGPADGKGGDDGVNHKSFPPPKHAFRAALLGSAVSIAIPFGCRRPPEATGAPAAYRQEACNSADSPAICREVQKCFQSNVAIVVCRELEDDAIQISRTPTQPADNGAANALKY